MVATLTKTQAAVVARVQAAGGEIVRYSGGFWSTRDAVKNGRGNPDWFVQVPTIRAMERIGILERTNEFADEWRDTRRLAQRER